MGNYDAEIRVSTKVETSQMQKLQIQIDKAVDKVDALTKKYDALKNKKIPTQEYIEVQKQIENTEKKLSDLLARQERFLDTGGKKTSSTYKRMEYDLEELRNSLPYLKSELQDLVDTGKAFTIGADKEEISNTAKELSKAKAELRMLVTKQNELGTKSVKVSDILKKISNASHNAFRIINRGAEKAFSSVSRGARQSSGLMSSFMSRLKGLAASAFIFNLISKGFSSMVSSMKTGFTNLMGYSNNFANSIQSVKNSLSTLGNQIAAAFAPIVQAVIPWLNQLINMITTAMSYVSQFIAALTGKSTYIRAKKVQDSYNSSLGDTSSKADDAANSMDDMADSAKKARGALAAFDDLDVLEKQDDSAADKIKDLDNAIKDLGSGSGGGVGDLFEEAPIENNILDAVEKFKEILEQLFAPLKEAWEREGEFVMRAWKYALDEIWQLIKSIGSDFLEVWQQEETIKIFEDLLHIIGDIGLIVGNLAHNFRLAWEENETGKRILEGIRDIIGVIVANIRHAADATVEWSKNLDFSPLLTKVQGWIDSLVPVFDNLSGIITDFYEKVLLPLGKWTLEKGLPELLQVFIDFNNKVDWEALRSRLAQFWEHLEPFAETVGEGLILFIERCTNALANFINSPVFDSFLTMIENWMDNVKPEDVADALEAIAKAIITLKVAVVGFSAVAKGLTMLSSLYNILKLFGAGGEISSALGVLKSIGTTIAGWAPHIAVGVAIVDLIKKIKDAVSERIDTSGFGLTDWISETLKLALEGWKQEFEGWKISLELWWQDTWMADTIWKFGQWWNEKVKPWFASEKWAELWEGIKTAFTAKWDELIEWWNSSTLVTWWNESVVPWFSTERWLELGENIKLAFVEKWTEIQEWFTEFWTIFTETLYEIWENIILFFTEAWENITLIFQTFVDFINDTVIPLWKSSWETAQTIFQAFQVLITIVIDAINTLFNDFFGKVVKELIDGNWKNAWENAKKIFTAFKEKISEVINTVKEIIQSFFDWAMELINSILSAIGSIGSAIAGIFGGGGSSGGGGGASFAMASTATYSLEGIPALATGSVIRGGNPFMAILGDQPRGQTNVEAPLDTIKQAVREEMSDMNFGSGSLNAEMTLDGETVGRLLLPYVLDEMMRQGYDVDILGVT